MSAMAGMDRVLVVGGTGHLGGQVVRRLREQGRAVRALVRPGSDAAGLEAQGVEIARGDMMDPASLEAAMAGMGVVITSAAGYTARRKGDTLATDDLGNLHLVAAAKRAGVRRFVFTSVLTCDQTPDVPHFWAKKRVEDALREQGVPFVSLRPGAFIDQAQDLWADGLRKGRLMSIGDPSVRWTYLLTEEVARCLVLAVDAPGVEGRTIDLGCDVPVSTNDVAALASRLLKRQVRVRKVPWPLINAGTAVVGLFSPMVRDMRPAFRHFLTGRYVADTTLQARYFGAVPSAEASLRRYMERAGLLAAA